MFVEGSRKCGAVDLQLRDKVAVIGGASKGLGRACAEVLAQEGVKVALCSRSATDLDKAAKEIRDATGADVLAAGASSISSPARCTSRSLTWRSPAPPAWAWSRSPRAWRTRSGATASWSTTYARARS